MLTSSLLTLLTPRSIAIVGASSDPSKFSGRVLGALVRHGFTGKIYPINSKQDSIAGLRAYSSLDDITEPIDCVLYSIAASSISEVLSACERNGHVKLLVVTSAGFAERNDEQGHALQASLSAFAARTGTRVMGPNCLGFLNTIDATALAAGAVLEVPDLGVGRIGVVSQSGGLAFGTILIGGHQRGIAYSRMITTGNEADLDLVDWFATLLDDDDTDAIALTIEGVRDGNRFLACLAKAQHLNKPVVILKTGRTSLGETMAMSHTGSIAGSQAVFASVCAQYGATLVNDLEALIEISAMFAKLRKSGKLVAGAPRADRSAGCAALSISGGHIGLFADLGSEAGLRFPVLSLDTQQKLAAELKVTVPVINPVDLSGGSVANPGLWGHCAQALLGDGQVDIVLPIMTIARNYDSVSNDLLRTDASSRKIVMAVWPGSWLEGEGKALLRNSVMPIFDSQTVAAAGAAALVSYWRVAAQASRQSYANAQAQANTTTDVQTQLRTDAHTQTQLTASNSNMREDLLALARKSRIAGERESKQLLARIGLPVVGEILVTSLQDAVAAAHKVGFPVVLKGLHPDITHKSDAGLVWLKLSSSEQVQEAFEAITTALTRLGTKDLEKTSVLVQEMIPEGIEVLLGVRRDSTFGPCVVFGLGGIYVEVLKDFAVRKAPLRPEEALEMINEIKGIALLKGARGREPADLNAIAALLVALGDFAVTYQDIVSEVEINPLIIVNGKQTMLRAVDALLVFKDDTA
jgi:acyl-CoA synthetase (NDP forming)